MADLNDPARLAELHQVLLRDDADAILDTCVERATELTQAPMALVSLIVRHIQLFRAHRGLPPELCVSCATSRSNSFCQLVVRHEAPLVVEDALVDERVPKELVERYGIRAYAGVPIRVRQHVVGSFCVLDVVPRGFGPRVVEGLKQLAAEVGARIEVMESDAPPPSRTLKERLARFEQSARLLEHALGAIAPVLAEAQSAAATLPEAPPAALSLDDLRAAVDCYRDMFAIATELAEDAMLISRSFPAETASEIALATRSLARDMVEIGPLVRLAEGVLQGTLGEGVAAKAAHVVRDAFAAHETASAAVRRIIATVERARATEVW
ncbi:diguanylate cyclase [Sorangium cellulosum]|uniref:Diguanylate cyclase n=2 Tax=Sorangium cellulosum TaxID=56 RepID=A0A150PV95_SORCE|nr:GAF domain-containing protein [Sorangium cellulosum]AGP38244.1 diguanylate cyclase [Sorangium cellulosum So0157-2]KYF59503.1 diguanylate cyclase [Sorangium cellulosum]